MQGTRYAQIGEVNVMLDQRMYDLRYIEYLSDTMRQRHVIRGEFRVDNRSWKAMPPEHRIEQVE